MPGIGRGLVHHSDRGSPYVSMRYTEGLAEAGLEPSVGSVGESFGNALAETTNGLYNAEVIWRKGPRKTMDAFEYATLEYFAWFNHRSLACSSRSKILHRQKPRQTTLQR